jgi:hypothetical protein
LAGAVSKVKTTWRNAMLRGAAISIALIFLASCFGLGTTFAASPDDTTEKTIPQG